jgi:RNA polymerase sigma-70 factor (ECF subfamily)
MNYLVTAFRDRFVVTQSFSSDRVSDEFLVLLCRARGGDTESLGVILQWYVNYLTILATTQLDHRLRRRVNPSDLVQETLLAAHRDFVDFRGNSQPELLGWLRQILIHALHGAFARHVKAGKRDIRREVSIDRISNQMEESACNLAAILPGRAAPPSGPMRARERAVELADQLNKLSADHRDVIVSRVLQGLSFEEIAKRMGRSCGAVRMLWLRALGQFRVTCENLNDV